MAATTGAKLTIPFTVGTSQIVGQGNAPEVWALYSTDDASVATPTWNDATSKLRSFSTSRGRESELADVDAGTAQIVLDNRSRTFDPIFNSAIRPMNRWWLREQFSGSTQDFFRGYADSYDQQWPSPGDAEAVVSCTDEMKNLALGYLPVMDPPSPSYEDVVLYDEPVGYWRMNDDANVLDGELLAHMAVARVGSPLTTTSSLFTATTGGAIVGEVGNKNGFQALVGNGATFSTGPLEDRDAGDVGGLTEFAVETWFKTDIGDGGTTLSMVQGPGPPAYELILTNTGFFRVSCQNSAATTVTITSPTVIKLNTWYHVVGTITGLNLRLYVNGSQVASAAWSGSFPMNDVAAPMQIYSRTSGNDSYDEVAIYRRGLPAERVLAHYTAGTARGFPTQLPGIRIGAILDAVSSHAPRRLDTGVRDVIPRYMTGQDPLGEIRLTDRADDPDSVVFVARDGTVVFLDGDHRSSSPYSVVQATFDDDGTDLPYGDLDLDYSEAFLLNEITATRANGPLKTASDATSIARYGKRGGSFTDFPVTTDAAVQAIADAVLAKYKEPMFRVLSLVLTTADPAVAEAIFQRDIGDRIRVFRTPPGGGARIDQTLFIQKIDVAGANDQKPWTITLGVSPL
jgi:hypothetical protein